MVYKLIFVYIIIMLLDISELLYVKKKKIVTLFVYGILYMLGFIISFLLIIDKKPISPAIIIEKIIGSLMGR